MLFPFYEWRFKSKCASGLIWNAAFDSVYLTPGAVPL